MTDWLTYKGEGPWDLFTQVNKWGYVNNPRWTERQDALEFCEELGLPINLPDKHFPCGYWYNGPLNIISVGSWAEIDTVSLSDPFGGSGRNLVKASDGSLHCVYSDTISGYRQILYAKSVDGGKTWSITILTTGNYHQYRPSLAIDGNDHLHVVWDGANSSSPSYNQIRYRKFTTFWNDIEELTTYAGYYHQKSPSIATDDNNYVHVVWYGGFVSTSRPQIVYKKYTTSWQSIEYLTVYATEFRYQYSPSIAIDSSNNIHVVWYGTHPGSTTYYQIRYRKYTTSWQTIENLTDEVYSQMYPSITIGPSDYIHVVWSGNYTPGPVYKIRYIKYTTSWQTIIDLVSETGLDQAFPSICISSKGYIYAVWHAVRPDFPTYTQIRSIRYITSWETIENLIGAIPSVLMYPKLLEGDYLFVFYDSNILRISLPIITLSIGLDEIPRTWPVPPVNEDWKSYKGNGPWAM